MCVVVHILLGLVCIHIFILGLASRLCDGDPVAWQDPNVKNCSTVEITKSKEEIKNLNESSNLSLISKGLQSITGILANATNVAPIFPNDLRDIINIVGSILR